MSHVIHLPISANYVKHWGFWEAVREILQNAIDTDDFELVKMISSGIIQINSSAGVLDLSSLVLGETTKADNSNKIGKYGEGYKLALLVLCRLGHRVLIKNGFDCWQVSISEHPQLKVDCLTIKVIKGTYIGEHDGNSVSFTICDLKDEHYNILEQNYIGKCDGDDFYVEAENNGSYCFTSDTIHNCKKVFVGGLFVCDLDNGYHYSYNFAPNILELDRDRNSVSSFYLQLHATELLSESGNIELLVQMATDKAKDVSDYYKVKKETFYGSSSSSVFCEQTIKIAIDGFVSKHGKNAFPIDSSKSFDKKKTLSERCVYLGLVPVEVKPVLHEIIKSKYEDKLKVEKLNGKISEVLTCFIKSNRKQLTSLGKKRLINIIDSIKIQGE